ncbi:TonB-dependent receptor [Zunongwangia endophytica]|uniref:TonB-dependent receptor domain-containing protein n=1 Tax=Zunongwangia endophytica TaxID=1808945 RepID=A0ABV8H2A2_9FLAO|nr:TonB-dependent receptor [Zunongwangia endophytica]MDN3596566.1 TonB-dependent receptor [Zunongwangia endophytica]
MKKIIITLILIISAQQTFSQELKGQILNSTTSEGIADVNIIAASKVVAISDSDGFFTIENIDFPIVLKFSSIGFVRIARRFEESDSDLKIYLSPSSESLSEVKLRSTLIPTELQQTPAAVSLLSKADLKRTDAVNFVGNLNYVPGVYVNQGALNTNKITIRGIGSRAQYSTNRIQAYFDGIPLATAEGSLTLDDIDQESLERVEVIKGPTSSIYGAGLGGSINLYSADPGKNESRVGVKVQGGSYNTWKKSDVVSINGEKTSVFATYNHVQSDGWRENGAYDRKSGLVNAKLLTSEKNSLSFLANFVKLKAYIPSSINEDDFLNDPETAAYTWGAAKGYESYDRGLLGVSYQHHISENFTNQTSVFLSFRNGYEPRPFDILKEERLSAGARTNFSLSTAIFNLPSEISFGAQYYNEWYETGTFENLYEDFDNIGSVRGARLSNNEQDRHYANFFAQLNMNLTEKLLLEAGINFNTTGYSLDDLYAEDATNQTGNYTFDAVFSPRLGLSYEVAEDKNLYASLSHGFSTPTVAETLTPEGQINTDLKAESGFNYEIGFKGNWLNNRLYTEVSVYSIQVRNLLVAQRVAEDRYVGINAGKSDHNGIEFFGKYTIPLAENWQLSPFVNAAFNFFEFDRFVNEEVDYSGNELPGVPKHTINAGLDLNTEFGFSFNALYRNVGEIPLNDANALYSDAYNLVNIKAAYTFNIIEDLQLNVYGGLNNVFDEHYAASVLPNAVGFGGAQPRYYYPGYPRNFFTGLAVNYLF